MEISEIKARLTLAQVLHYYHLKPDKQLRLCCPFHDDKTPSLQIYYKTHTAYCFSANCPTHGKSLDVIDFIMWMEQTSRGIAGNKEGCTKHEAILKAGQMITEQHSVGAARNQKPTTELPRIAVLTKIFTYFKNGVHNSKPAQEYLQQRGLDYNKTEVGYNSGQFHHGERKDAYLIESCVQYGLLLDLEAKSRTGNPAYKPFGKWCIVFALRNAQNQIVGLYFRSTLEDKHQRHFYLRDRQGLYPKYLNPETKRLILTESIIDAATLLEQEPIKSRYEVLALYGTNGLTEEHTKAITELKELEEIIFFLNGDQAGIKAVEKYAPMLKGEHPKVKITQVQVPENEDVNSLLQGHSSDILTHLIETRKEYDFLFSSESRTSEKEAAVRTETTELPVIEKEREEAPQPQQTGLDTNDPYNLKYTGNEANYQIKGFNTGQLDSLRITLQITAK